MIIAFRRNKMTMIVAQARVPNAANNVTTNHPEPSMAPCIANAFLMPSCAAACAPPSR
jgi:hypothetical protein